MEIKKSVEELMQEFGEVKPIFDHVGLLTYDREKASGISFVRAGI